MGKRHSTSAEILHSKNWAEVERDLEAQPNVVRVVKNNSTVKIYGPHGMTLLHCHPTQAPKLGTLRAVLRMAILAGILASAFILLLFYLL